MVEISNKFCVLPISWLTYQTSLVFDSPMWLTSQICFVCFAPISFFDISNMFGVCFPDVVTCQICFMFSHFVFDIVDMFGVCVLPQCGCQIVFGGVPCTGVIPLPRKLIRSQVVQPMESSHV